MRPVRLKLRHLSVAEVAGDDLVLFDFTGPQAGFRARVKVPITHDAVRQLAGALWEWLGAEERRAANTRGVLSGGGK